MSLDAARGLLACPVCARPLGPDAGSWACPTGHRFDVARQGHLNLLGGPQPASADTPAMVDARARVHATGLYEPIAVEIGHRLTRCSTVLEGGAGTGYYLASALAASARGVALDVSVAAARRAAKADARVASVVADCWGTLPLLGGRFAGVLCAFAPRNLAEFARVLTPGGLLVVVAPTASHLDGLRERYGLLSIEAGKEERLARSAVGLFEPVATKRLDYTRAVEADTVRDVIAMGPNAFHGVPAEVTDAEVHVSVTVHLYRSVAPQAS